MLTKFTLRWLIFLACLTPAGRSFATIYYVSTGGSNANSGTSWPNAFADLQTAVNAAGSGDSIFIASGNYIGSQITNFTRNLNIYGSFEGSESSPAQRVFAPADTTVLNGNSDPTIHNTAARSTTVLLIQGTNAKIIVDGVKITNGVNYNNADAFAMGGGVLINGDTAAFNRCVIVHNGADNGSGICLDRGYLFLSRSIVSDNWGSGSLVIVAGTTVINQCRFNDNQAGGIDANAGLTVTNTLFSYNQGDESVGAVNIQAGTTTLINNTFYMDTIIVPVAGHGSALTVGAGSTVIFQNNIIWACGNGSGNVIINKGTLTSSYNIGQDMTVGTTTSNNTTPTGSMGFVDSTLVNPNGLELTAGSPAVNAGDTAGVSAYIGNVDLPGNLRFQGCRIDLGAYESSWSGLTSLSLQPVNDSVCSGGNAIFKTSASGDSPVYQWQSSPGSNIWNVLGGATDTALVLSSVNAAMDRTQYRCIVTGTGLCTSADTTVAALLALDVPPSITAQPYSDTVCSGSGAIFMIGVSGSPLYQWQSGTDGNSWNNVGGGSTDSLDLSPVDPGMNNTLYRCIIMDARGCRSNDTSAQVTLTVKNGPGNFFLGNDTTLCTGESLGLFVNLPDSGLTYSWQDGSGQPQFQVNTAGTYSVRVSNSCASLNQSIDVKYQTCACNFYIPSAFTPNGDGKNDLFKPQYKCYFSNYQLEVFNRWGQVIFSSPSADTGWDGTLNGLQQPEGAYVWEMSYQDNNTGHKVVRNGTVILIR